MKNLFLSIIAAACFNLLAAGSTFAADNINVELSEEGVLSIVGEKLHPSSSSYPFLRLHAVDGELHFLTGSTINGQMNPVPYDLDEVTEISVRSIDDLHLWLIDPFLIADLSIDARKVTIVSFAAPDLGAIIGTTSITNGLDRGDIFISRVAFVGNVEISTGHGADYVNFGSFDDISPFAGPVDIWGNLSINTGQGGDELGFSNLGTYVEGDIDIQMGQGFDRLVGEDNLSTEPDSSVSIVLGQQ